MLTFRPMCEEEYPAYLEYFITDYAQEIAANYRLSEEEALTSAKQEIAAMLPEGVNTPGHVLLCLLVQDESNHKHTGYLWYKPEPGMQTVFIYDFHIFTACQGRGLGKDALRAFEDEMRAVVLSRSGFA